MIALCSCTRNCLPSSFQCLFSKYSAFILSNAATHPDHSHQGLLPLRCMGANLLSMSLELFSQGKGMPLPQNAVLGCNLKNNRMIFHFQCKPFNITVIQVYVPSTNVKEIEVEGLPEDLTGPSRTDTEKENVIFIIGDWNAKVRCQEKPGVTSKFGPWCAKWNRAKAVLPRECTGHSQHSLPTTQGKTLHKDITRWSIRKSDWLYILCSWRWRNSIESATRRAGADCGSDHKLLIAKFRLKLKKVGNTTRPCMT